MRTLLAPLMGIAVSLLLLSCTGQESAGTWIAPVAPVPPDARVEICHYTGDGGSHVLEVSSSALPAHIANHGDHLLGPEVCDGIDNDCDGAVDGAGICYCPCDLAVPDPPPFPAPHWTCTGPAAGDPPHARLQASIPPSPALWWALVTADPDDPSLHVCSRIELDSHGRVVLYESVPGLDDAEAYGCFMVIIQEASDLGVTCDPA